MPICDFCQEEMLYTDNISHTKYFYDRDCEPEQIIDKREYTCPECNNVIWIPE
jgi:hypothetical protein